VVGRHSFNITVLMLVNNFQIRNSNIVFLVVLRFELKALCNKSNILNTFNNKMLISVG
jgi:hypothetical protein